MLFERHQQLLFVLLVTLRSNTNSGDNLS